jgi:hypothetical protein
LHACRSTLEDPLETVSEIKKDEQKKEESK